MDTTFDNYMTYGAIMTFNKYKKFRNCYRYVKAIIQSRNDITVKRGTDTKFRDACNNFKTACNNLVKVCKTSSAFSTPNNMMLLMLIFIKASINRN